MEQVLQSLARVLPEATLTVGLLLVVFVDASGVRARNGLNWLLTVLSLRGLALCPSALEGDFSGPVFSGMLAVDPLGVFFKMLLLGASLLLVLTFTFRNSRELAGLGQSIPIAFALAAASPSLLFVAMTTEKPDS